jgi:hypothetical protein
MVGLGMACIAHAQKADPHQRKETDSFSDPIKTYDAFLRAIKANDLPKARACHTISDKDDSRTLDVIVGIWITFHRFSETARSKLGNRAWAELQEWNCNIARDECTNEAIERTRSYLKQAVVTKKNDTAEMVIKWGPKVPFEEPVFHFSEESPIAVFRQVKGDWKLDFRAETGMEKAADFFKPGGWGSMIRDEMQIIEKTTLEIERGKLTTAQQTIDALEGRLEALKNKYDPDHVKERAAWRQKEKEASNVPVPNATDFPTGSLAWASSHCPIVAVAPSGVTYVFWVAKGQERAPNPVLPLIPTEYAFNLAKEPEWSSAPAVSVYRNGVWSKPAVLVEGKRQCMPVFAWCQGESLHLLVSGEQGEFTNHLVLDSEQKSWKRVAQLPVRLWDDDMFRQLGSTVHVATIEGNLLEARHVSYLLFNGSEWSKPLPIKESENRYRGTMCSRLAVGKQGTAYVGWWSDKSGAGIYGLAAVRSGQVSATRIEFADKPIRKGEFDLGVAPNGAVLIAYQAALPDEHADAKKLHVRRREGERWTAPELIGGEGTRLHGAIRVFGNDRATLVTWVTNEDYPVDGGILAKSFRRLAATDGKTWTHSRWIARQQSLRGKGVPESAPDVQAAIDVNGRVHMVWSFAYCMVFNLVGDLEKK